MMPADVKTSKVQSIITQNKALDKIIVSIASPTNKAIEPDEFVSYINDFSTTIIELDKQKIIERIETQQDDEKIILLFEAIQSNLPFLLDDKDYLSFDTLLTKEHITRKLESNLRELSSPNGLAMKQLLLNDPLGFSYPALNKLLQLKLDEHVQLYDGYISNQSLDQFTFFIYPKYPSSNTDKNQGLEQLIKDTKTKLSQIEEYKTIECDAFGSQLVAAGNAVQMKSDTILTLSLTLILLSILFFYVFRNKYAPIQILIPVVFGGLFGISMMFLIKGAVSMIALGASSIILGIAVNYSLHFMSHLKHAKSKEDTIKDLAEPMTIGSFTTVAAFLSLNFVHTPILKELGLFAAFNLIGSSICTLIFLPHFIKKVAKNHQPNLIDKIAKINPSKSKWTIIFITGLTIILSFFINQVRFNDDMMKMNYMSDELLHAQKIINERNSESLNSIFCISEGNNFDEALSQCQIATEQLAAFKNKGVIKKYISMSDFLLTQSQQEVKINNWNQYWTKEKRQTLMQNLIQIGSQKGFNASAFDRMKETIETPYTKLNDNYFSIFKDFFKDFIIEKDKTIKLISLIKTKQEQRNSLFQSFQETSKIYLADKQLVVNQFVQFIKDDFNHILFLTSFIVFFTILITYGRIEIALITFIPMVITWICILGMMALFKIEFNIINIIISTLIFGLGDDYSIFITDSLIEKYQYNTQKFESVKSSIILSAITTIIGLGVLIFAKHPALRSIALVSVIGIFSILIVSQTIQPLLFNFFIQNRTNKKLHPFTLWSFIKTIFAFTYYFLGCMLVTLIGFILIKCVPFSKDKMKYAYHVVICKMMWSLLYIMGNTRKHIDDTHKPDFNTPSVIIANHSSFLDLLRIISLHPKILLLTNKWVWNSPVFGLLVQLANYYPVEEGAEFSIDKLKYWVDRGYHIAVFPEGTRSYDGEIKRFHKGAFYIAEKLQLDIQPILFHGIGYTMSKGDFLLKDGEINIKYLPRISQNDTQFGKTYSEKAKNIGRYFRDEFKKYKQANETPAYFREQLLKNYYYKGPILEWYCRIKTKLENNYSTIISFVPQTGKILDIGCGYGFLDYMLAWTSDKRSITAIDYDENKIATAHHNFSKTNQINFIQGDALDFPKNEYDCIISLDVLHYLIPEKQKALLLKCADSLSENGTMIIRDGISDLEQKHKGTILTEKFSTQIFNFNKTENELHFISKKLLEEIAIAKNLTLEWIDNTKYTSNLIAILRK
ncbi:MAG: MMPL family transporter [Chitinophagaceae bacterium]|nr:MMPL family transporter [Chitinophagaceae bacterium]